MTMGKSMLARIAMTEITTSNSISVKPVKRFRVARISRTFMVCHSGPSSPADAWATHLKHVTAPPPEIRRAKSRSG